jgi:hypothetical protein
MVTTQQMLALGVGDPIQPSLITDFLKRPLKDAEGLEMLKPGFKIPIFCNRETYNY